MFKFFYYPVYRSLIIIVLLFITVMFLNLPRKTHTAVSIMPQRHQIVNTISAKQKPKIGPIECYRMKGDSLPDISDTNLVKGKSIFFHETSCNSYSHGKIIISSRQACAVESAARANPSLDVYLLFTSPGQIKNENTTSSDFLKALLAYKNIKIQHLNYERYIKNTPLEDLYNNRELESSKYSLSHASDILRYLTLWKYGGTYLDLDVIVLKGLDKLSSNFAGSESEDNVAAGVLNFASNGTGHHLAELCIKDLQYNFSGNKWGYNGPGVITRLLKNVCHAKKAKEMLNLSCAGFKVYPPEAFYPIPWHKWEIYFDRKYNNKIFNLIKNSYVVHVWNNFSKNKKINLKSRVPYSILAKKYCPKVFAKCNKFF